MSVVLIGYRGSGKTMVGRALAERMNKPFVDLDELIVERAGKNIRDIFQQDGESRFRDLESELLAKALEPPEKVLSVGGGALDRENNRRILAAGKHRVIYLHCEPMTLLSRINADQQTAVMRPALTRFGGGIDEISAVLARREPVYRLLLTDEIDVTQLTIEQVVDRIVGGA